MKKYLIILLVGLMTACSTIRVSYDYDTQADFSRYSTFAFDEEALNLPINQLNRDRMLDAIEKELVAKGLAKSENPDLLVNVQVKTEKQVQATANTVGTAYRPYRYGWGGGFSTTRIDYNEYVEGTLFINLVDKAENKIIWQGIGKKTIDENASAQKREANINYAIERIISNYPPKR